MLTRKYNSEKTVYDATIERLDFIFANFERIYISFSGGKDSGVLLNITLQYMRERGIKRKIGIQILDNEANYEYSLEFMRRILDANRDLLEIYWCCMPVTLPCTVSAYHINWQCWGEADKDRWVRPRPEQDYVVGIHNHPFGDAFRENMNYDEFWDMFAEFYSQGKSCANLIGIRCVESLNRFRAIMNEEKEMLQGRIWTKKNTSHVFNCYPIFDWRTEDIWTANAKYGWDYNKLYDVFYMAGVPVHKMRVASPFMSESKSSLNLYRVIDPHTWARLCARVGGANFVATYGKQLGYKSIKLPPGHTWKSFTKFLLSTLPGEAAQNFKERFAQSILFWGRTGRAISGKALEELRRSPVRFKENGLTNHGRKDKPRIRIQRYPDHVDFLPVHNSEVASWKRLAVTILKNDHTCKYLGLAQTQRQLIRQREIVAKYGAVITGRAK